MWGIKSVAVQLNTSPLYVGEGKAGGGGAAGVWRPQQLSDMDMEEDAQILATILRHISLLHERC